MVTAVSAQGSGKLVGKDYVFIAIFGLLLFIVFFAFAMVLGMNANTFWKIRRLIQEHISLIRV